MPGPHFVSAAAYSCRFQSEPDITMMTPLHLTNFRVVGAGAAGLTTAHEFARRQMSDDY
jgi:hypothetical protein